MTSITLKRIQTEYNMLLKDPPENFVAFPTNDDLFNWHFTIRGADDTEFDGGIYHGVIKLPTNYPMKPPSIMFLTVRIHFLLSQMDDLILIWMSVFQ
jgi:ubiquitin-conjugating enzyme E2 J1